MNPLLRASQAFVAFTGVSMALVRFVPTNLIEMAHWEAAAIRSGAFCALLVLASSMRRASPVKQTARD